MSHGDPAEDVAFVSVALAPDTIRVASGETFSLELKVDIAGKAFNAYDAIVSYDTTALAFESPQRDRDGEGALMTGACGNTFHRFTARGDSLAISHVILCGGVSLTGPGTLHRLQFRARAATGESPVRLRRVQFYNAGLFVNPARTHDAIVVISPKTSLEKAAGMRLPQGRTGAAPLIEDAESRSATGGCQG